MTHFKSVTVSVKPGTAQDPGETTGDTIQFSTGRGLSTDSSVGSPGYGSVTVGELISFLLLIFFFFEFVFFAFLFVLEAKLSALLKQDPNT